MKPELAALISEALEQLVSDGVLAEMCPSQHRRSIARKIRVMVICLAILPW